MEGPRDAAAPVRSGGGLCALLRTVAQPQSKGTPHCGGQRGVFLILISVFTLIPVGKVSSHPQCLDFRPPFKPAMHLEFCSQYELLGCCDQDADNLIAERYWDIIDYLELQGSELCSDMLKEVMCQVKLNLHSSCCCCCPALHFGLVPSVPTCSNGNTTI